MARQDKYEQRKPCYDRVQQKTINFILCLTWGVTGGLRQGQGQSEDRWENAPLSLIGAFNYLLFGGTES